MPKPIRISEHEIQCEHDLQKQIIEDIIARGGIVIRVNAGGSIKKRGGWIKLAKGGTSDTIALYKGVFLAIELKYDCNAPSDKQIAFLESVAEAGGVGLVAYDSEFVEKIMMSIDDNKFRKPMTIWGLIESSCPNRLFVKGV
jgi:hypothetical protein